jgi:hypothetical protein
MSFCRDIIKKGGNIVMSNNQNKYKEERCTEKNWKWLTGLSIGAIGLLTTILVGTIIFKISQANDPIIIQNAVSIIATLMSIALPFAAIIYLRFNVLSRNHFYKISD